MTDSLLSEFYENIDRKNWTVNVIQQGLYINDELLYTTIYSHRDGNEVAEYSRSQA